MHDARGVANYFVERAYKRGVPVTVMTLLKVLYFAHAWHLAKFKRPLVAQPFEAWKYRPVNRVVYDQLRDLGKKPINFKLKSFDVNVCAFVETPFDGDCKTKDFLNNIFDYYSQFDPFKLSDLTHENGSPWDVVWNTAERQAVPGMLIPDSLIMEWFQKNTGAKSSSVQ